MGEVVGMADGGGERALLDLMSLYVLVTSHFLLVLYAAFQLIVSTYLLMDLSL